MLCGNEPRRVLIAAGAEMAEGFADLFRRRELEEWEPAHATSFSQARFLLQHDRCDLLLVNDDLYEREGSPGLAWLASQPGLPIVFLVGSEPEHYLRAYQLGISVCLPRLLAFAHAKTLAAGLDQALQVADTFLKYHNAREQLSAARRNTDRLVSMLWRSTPTPDHPWFPQRYMIERLTEELARTERYKLPLTVALGEIHGEAHEQADGSALPEWVPEVIVHGKRRSDLAGQYGTQGFMILMVQTNEEGGVRCCQRLRHMLLTPGHGLAQPHAAARSDLKSSQLQTSFGLATMGSGMRSPQAMLRRAEERLQAANARAGGIVTE